MKMKIWSCHFGPSMALRIRFGIGGEGHVDDDNDDVLMAGMASAFLMGVVELNLGS
jgi:hypothetical protein